MELLSWLENTPLSILIREAIWFFPSLLILHAVGMAFLVGTSIAVNLCMLGLVPNVPLRQFQKFHGLVVLSFTINLISGLLLLLSYPAKGLTNPVFFIKMGLVIVAAALTQYQFSKFKHPSLSINPAMKYMATAILLLWLGGVFCGRFLAYTHKWLLVS